MAIPMKRELKLDCNNTCGSNSSIAMAIPMKRELKLVFHFSPSLANQIAMAIPMKRELKLHLLAHHQKLHASYCNGHPDEKGIETRYTLPASLFTDPIAMTIPTKRELKRT